MDAVTVTTNDADYLRGLLACESLMSSFDRLVVVDNSSEDGSRELAEAAGATVVTKPRGGYGAAINHGVELCRGPYVAVLNPDIRFFDDQVVDRLVTHFDDPAVAIVAPALRLLDGSLQDSARRTPTLANLIVRRLRDPLAGAIRESGDVDWVVGACFLARRDVWDELGGFDERYVLYFEDVDLCERVRGSGRKVRFDSSVVVEHAFQGASRKSLNAPATRRHVRSAMRFYRSNPARLLARCRRSSA